MRRLLAAVIVALPLLASAEVDYPENDVEVIEPPRPAFPELAAFLGIAGRCEIHISLWNYDSVNIDDAACTSPLFCEEAMTAIRNVKMKVVDVPGAEFPGRRHRIYYPLDFLLEGEPRPSPDAETYSCLDPLTS